MKLAFPSVSVDGILKSIMLAVLYRRLKVGLKSWLEKHSLFPYSDRTK